MNVEQEVEEQLENLYEEDEYSQLTLDSLDYFSIGQGEM